MCRKCGEPDRRGSARARRARRDKLLAEFGNGVICPCAHCATLVGTHAGYLTVPADRGPAVVRLPIARLEQDRIIPHGPYTYWNVFPSCGPCNRARTYTEVVIPDGCEYGPVA